MIKTAIVGCGNIFDMHADSIANLENAKLAAVCDIRPERAEYKAKKYAARAFTDYKQMLEKERPDVLHICLPHYLHAPVTEYALRAGVNVLCEKPMALDVGTAEKLAGLARQKKLRYSVVFQCRYNDASQTVKKYLENGSLGRVLHARVTLTWNRANEYYSRSDWKGTWAKEGGGLIINQMIHSLDLADWFIGSVPVKIQAHLANRKHPDIEVEDTAEGLVLYENGAQLVFYGNNNYGCDEPVEIRLLCEKGKVIMSYEEALISLDDGTGIRAVQGDNGIKYANRKDYWGISHYGQIKDFYESIAERRESAMPAENALNIQRLIDGIYEASKFRPVSFGNAGEVNSDRG